MAEQETPAQQFAVQRIYVKDSSFESPMSPKIFTQQWQPKVNVELNNKSAKIDDDHAEVTVTVTVTAMQDEETAFLAEVHQAGVFLIKGVEGEALRRALAVICPNLLFPYLREALDNMAIKGGFPPIALQPVNFEALYLQAAKQQQEKQAQKADTTH